MSPVIVEKDFWVCWILKRLFADPQLKDQLIFKGGTSLSKVYGLIDRFSEDIDLILDWRLLGYGAPQGSDTYQNLPSKTQRSRYNQELNARAVEYIREKLLAQLNLLLAPVPGIAVAIEMFPNVFEERTCSVMAIRAERTFWEKATILHQEAHRPGAMPSRYSRHYYDFYKMASSTIKDAVFSDLPLLKDVVEFKELFYPSSWARYDLAVPGSFRLSPPPDQVSALARDYKEMREMFYREPPDFATILAALPVLEEEINRLT
jgi:predicted nucleotidyltransferase component of viral defense system